MQEHQIEEMNKMKSRLREIIDADKAARERNENESLKLQLLGWGVTLPVIALSYVAGAGWYSFALGVVAAAVVMTWRIKKNERKGVAK